MEKDDISLYDGLDFLEDASSAVAAPQHQPSMKEYYEETIRKLNESYKTQLLNMEAQRDDARKKRDEYMEKCKELEKRILNEESMYFRKQFDGARLSESMAKLQRPSSGLEKENDVNQKMEQYVEMRKPSLEPYFSTMDESQTVEGSIISETRAVRCIRTVADFGTIDMEDVMNQTQKVAANITTYADQLFNYRSNVVTLYHQLKGTARFLAEVVRRVSDEDDEQVKLLLQKIDALQLNIQENNTAAEEMVNQSKSKFSLVAEELSILGTSMRAATENSRQIPVNTELMAELEAERQKNINLVSEQKNLLKQCNEAVDKAHQRDEELENRAKIIDELTNALEQSQIDRVSVATLIKNEMSRIYDVMKTFPHKIEEQ